MPKSPGVSGEIAKSKEEEKGAPKEDERSGAAPQQVQSLPTAKRVVSARDMVEYFRTNQRKVEKADKVKRDKKAKLAEAKLAKQTETRHRALTTESKESRLKTLICRSNVNSINPKGQIHSTHMTIRDQLKESGSSRKDDKRGQSPERSYTSNFNSATTSLIKQSEDHSEEDQGREDGPRSAKVQAWDSRETSPRSKVLNEKPSI